MNRTNPSAKNTLPVSTYIIISVIGFLISMFCVYYYLHYIQGSVSEKVSQKIFYLILIVFGIAASALIFGAMNSYGVLSGEKLDTKFQFAGPVVGVILIVMGGFYLPKSATEQTIAIRVMNEQYRPVTNGKVVLYFSHHTREQVIDNMGSAVFSDINEDDIKEKLKIDIVSDGYSRLTFDTAINSFTPIQITLLQNRLVHVSGQVTDADDRPIKDVVIMVDGTRFYGRSVSNGTYSFSVVDYAAGDEITLVTSHKDYKDKIRPLKIEKQDMVNVDFVLQPLQFPSH
ncbi:MAG: carboxypeptidase-like regulatory domain-containing protein [Bacteroidota bacterium]|nr:carboxypeptidase-like regulatory domain-containing protein [Bacteroidota bacterium]